MVDREIILAKAGAAQKHLRRIVEKAALDLPAFLNDVDSQEVVLFNIQMAVQNCIDIAAHVVSARGLGVPGSYNEMFYILEENKYIGRDLAERMVRAVGFRNLIVHEYAKLDLERVHLVGSKHIHDLNIFIQTILINCRIST
jgi:uncharacterized protein YutE (UPF0331/DUF86 family)